VSYRTMNPYLVRDQVLFEEQAPGLVGYQPGDPFAVPVLNDGETVTFTRPNGGLVYCDRVELLSVIADGPSGLIWVPDDVPHLGAAEPEGAPPVSRTQENPPLSRRRFPGQGDTPPPPGLLAFSPIWLMVGGWLLESALG
jgi:hypothetical protein